METLSPRSHEEMIQMVGRAFGDKSSIGDKFECFISYQDNPLCYILTATFEGYNQTGCDFSIDIRETEILKSKNTELTYIQNITLETAKSFGRPFSTSELAEKLMPEMVYLGTSRISNGVAVTDGGEPYNFKRRACLTISTRLSLLKKKGFVRSRKRTYDKKTMWYIVKR